MMSFTTMEETRWSRAGGRNRFEKETQRVPFCPIRMSARHLSGDIKWVIGYEGQKVCKEVEAGHIKSRVVIIKRVLTHMRS